MLIIRLRNALDHGGGEDLHVPGQHDDVDVRGEQLGEHRRLLLRLAAAAAIRR